MDKETIKEIIFNAQETDFVDFKREFYPKIKNSDLPKDVAAFANSGNKRDCLLIFGVDDNTREICGIKTDSLPSQDNLDAYISDVIDPFISTEIGSFEIEKDKHIGFIVISSTNHNPPYCIKKDCGADNCIKQGDVYIRKGTCNKKATRCDLDNIYKNNGSVNVKIHDDILVVEPLHFENSICDPTYGHIDLELTNERTYPVLINYGVIRFFLKSFSVNGSIVSQLSTKNLREKPLVLPANSRDVYTLLFEFTSQDCVNFGFDCTGMLDYPILINTELHDMDGNVFYSDEKEITMIARGSILHKV